MESRESFREKSKKSSMFIITSIVSIIIFMGYSFYLIFMPHIYLEDGIYVDVSYGKGRQLKYKATYLFKDITKDVNVSGSYNYKRVGEYSLIYSVKNNFFESKIKQKVKVIDRNAPIIKLEGDAKVYLCPNSKYEEIGVSAIDDVDGDVSKNIKIEKQSDKIIYSVSDKAGNKRQVIRKIIYQDKNGPVINSNDDILVLDVFDNLELDGISAIDACDGDVSSSLKIIDNDFSTPGLKKIKYVAVDKSGNKTEKTRDVIVSNREEVASIYLTFDDGPKTGTTDVILDILKKYNVKATFFITNNDSDDLVKREFDEGHALAIHSATHDYAYIYSSVDNYFKDLEIVSNRIEKITGKKSYLVRFPGGSSNTVSRRYQKGIMSELSQELFRKNYRYFDWNVDSGDASFGKHTADEIYNNFVRRIKKDQANIVLMHDIKPYTRDALENIIKYGLDNGYTFKVLDQNTHMVRQTINN